jgi:hypothetical protein
MLNLSGDTEGTYLEPAYSAAAMHALTPLAALPCTTNPLAFANFHLLGMSTVGC